MKNIKIIKTLKAILALLFLIILITVFAVNNKSYSASGAIDLWQLPEDGGWYKDSTYFSVSFAHLLYYNNVYCIQKGQSFPRQGKYMQVQYIIKISGENAKIYKADRLYPDSGELIDEFDGEYNNLLAAIVSEGEMELGYGSNSNSYNDSQIALYYYWNDWLDESGADAYMAGSGANKTIVNTVGEGRVNELMSIYRNYASRYKYNATIYYMTPVFNSVQRLLLVERGDREELNIDIPVQKIWLDGENRFNKRTEITVELYANGRTTGQTLTLNQSNNWSGTFSDLKTKDSNGNVLKYTVKEANTPNGYISSVTGSEKEGFKITNTLLTQVKVVKEWDDKDDFDEFRPSQLKVTLFSNGVSTGKTVILNENNKWTATFDGLKKYDANGKEIKYTVQEESIAKYEKIKESQVEDNNNGYITWTITNKHEPHYDGYVEISGKVWIDKPDGKGNNIDGVYKNPETDNNSKDILKEGVTARLKYIDANGKAQLFNSNLPNVYETKTDSNGEYVIKVNYDNSQNVYKLYEDITTINKKLETAYIEFEYDGMKYTTVASTDSGADTSKAIENENQRNELDNNHSTTKTETIHPDNWTDKNINAVTKKILSYDSNTIKEEATIKYCNGNGTYIRTNPDGAWKNILPGTRNLACNSGQGHEIGKYEITVQKIPNINLGLFEREQPDIALFTDISKVEVEMNKQKYTYVYGVRSEKLWAEGGLQTKFQNKDTYTYRRPVNPADIAYLKEVSRNAMDVYVTYQISIANLSNTLTAVVDSIANYYDSNYIISDIIYGTIDNVGNIKGTQLKSEQISNPENNGKYNKITINGLGLETTGLNESANKLYIRYKINQEKLPELFDDNTPPLNNATEILAYTIKYGEKTLYAEQGIGGRTGKLYAGYDYDSHPGNAGIFINGDNRLEATKPEDDTDIAPSFALCRDAETKILSGTIWEDTDKDNGSGPDNFRLGDGKKSDSEKVVANVKVELYKVNDDGTTTLANLYKIDKTTGERSSKPAVTYSNDDGYYSFGNNEDGYSVVTDTYIIKFTYGKGIDNSITSKIDDTNISGRDYKSTIISSETEIYNLFNGTSNNEQWHLNIGKGYSIAVDDMNQRIAIDDLQYSNFNDNINITAYSKPFKMQVEFDPSDEKASSVLDNGKSIKNSDQSLKNELNVFDFGIIERAKEDIYVQKTINYIKVTLANGQVLTEGNPLEQNLNYVKAMGYKQKINNGQEARSALEKQMLIEIDKELIQGAQLEVRYAINVVNNSEKDYDYYVNDQIKTEYYYFGTNDIDKSPIITNSVNYLVDYVDSDFVYTWENSDNWQKVNLSDSNTDWTKLINEETVKSINSGKYTAYATTLFSNLAPGNTSQTEYATARKLLTSKDENIYENHIEILQIDSKTARTLEGNNTKPGNYVPSSSQRTIDNNINSNVPGRHEQDDDVAKIIITPPTGETSQIVTYVITAAVELMIVLTGIIYIKKKRLIK